VALGVMEQKSEKDTSPITQVAVALAAQKATIARRDDLLGRKWPDAASVAERLGVVDSEHLLWARRLRAADELFGVWSQRSGSYVYPEFQFAQGGLHPQLPKLLRALRMWVTSDQPENTKPDRGGWERVIWLYQPHPRLSVQALAIEADAAAVVANPVEVWRRYGALDDTPRAPAEVFAAQSDAVIALAEALAHQTLEMPD
jgi:hypothetical protein